MRLVWIFLGLLLVATRLAAESSSLLGASRQDVIDFYGPPTSQVLTAKREVMVYTTGRVVLDDGKVVEITLPPPSELPSPRPGSGTDVKSIHLRSARPANDLPEDPAAAAERSALYEKWMPRAVILTVLAGILGWWMVWRKPPPPKRKIIAPPPPPTEPVVVRSFTPLSTRPPVLTKPPMMAEPVEEPIPPGTTPPMPVGKKSARDLTLNQKLLNKLEWRRLEMLASRYFEPLGFTSLRKKVSEDGTVDIDFFEKGSDALYARIRCKGWLIDKVGTGPVRNFSEELEAAGLASGQFIITGEFTSEAHELAELKNIELINGAQVVERLNALSPVVRGDLLEAVLAGDYSTPTCIKCDVKMVLRGDGERPIWACRNLPVCQATLTLRAAKD